MPDCEASIGCCPFGRETGKATWEVKPPGGRVDCTINWPDGRVRPEQIGHRFSEGCRAILMSGGVAPDDIAEAARGFVFLRKPVSFDTLLKAIKGVNL